MKKETNDKPKINKPPKIKNRKCCPCCGKNDTLKGNGFIECTKCMTGFKMI